MTESNPSTSNADEERLPTNAEDRKAAAALSSLNDNEISGADGSDADGRSSSRHFPSKADQEALGKAMSRLEIAAGGKSGSGSSGAGAGKSETAGSSGEEVKKKVVKVAAEDVALLVEHLDLTKNKATELLKAHDGNSTEAIKAFIAPPVPVVSGYNPKFPGIVVTKYGFSREPLSAQFAAAELQEASHTHASLNVHKYP